MLFVGRFDDDAPERPPIRSPPMHALSALWPKPAFEHMEPCRENTNNRARGRSAMVKRRTIEKPTKNEVGSMPIDRHVRAPPSPPDPRRPTKRCIDAIPMLEACLGDVWADESDGTNGKGSPKHEDRPFFTTRPPPLTPLTPPLPLSRVSYTMVEVSREEEKVCRAIGVCLVAKIS